MSEPSRSPLKARSLRNPGQSVEEALDEARDEKILQPLFVALFMVVMAALEWWRDYFKLPPRPDVYTIVAALGIAYAWWRVRRALPRLRQLRLAAEGERSVGQYLERLRARGYEVFHDLVGDGFNVDHVLIGPAGIYTVETKTFSKPAKGSPTIEFDGDSIRVAGWEPDRDPVVQAKAQAAWLRQILSDSTGKNFVVRPVVVFPGWFIEQPRESFRDIWILNPKALPTFLDHQPDKLEESDVKLASFHLSRFCRATK